MPLPCNRCGTPLPAAGEEIPCEVCGAWSTVRVFPALWRDNPGTAAEAAAEGEATCYDHPAKRAVAACARCGRFVCQLCAVDFKGAVWCPGCVMTPAAELEPSRRLYDSGALLLATLPLLVWPFTLITAPLAMYVAIRYWKRPLSLTRRWRWRQVLALVLATVQIAGWVWLLSFMASVTGRRL